SLTAPTRVVLPTPKPPATRIFSATRVMSGSWRTGSSERAKTIDHLTEDSLIRQLRRRNGSADAHQLRIHEVADQDPDYADGQVGLNGELRNGQRLILAQLDNVLVFQGQWTVGVVE